MHFRVSASVFIQVEAKVCLPFIKSFHIPESEAPVVRGRNTEVGKVGMGEKLNEILYFPFHRMP